MLLSQLIEYRFQRQPPSTSTVEVVHRDCVPGEQSHIRKEIYVWKSPSNPLIAFMYLVHSTKRLPRPAFKPHVIHQQTSSIPYQPFHGSSTASQLQIHHVFSLAQITGPLHRLLTEVRAMHVHFVLHEIALLRPKATCMNALAAAIEILHRLPLRFQTVRHISRIWQTQYATAYSLDQNLHHRKLDDGGASLHSHQRATHMAAHQQKETGHRGHVCVACVCGWGCACGADDVGDGGRT